MNKLFQITLLAAAQIMTPEANAAAPAFRDCPDCPEMVVIPAGGFLMDFHDGNDDGMPIHRVAMKNVFALGQTEVTQGQWKAVMGSNPSSFPDCGDSCPVENVSWIDAQEYLQKLNAKTGKQYRLPTGAEWEYACYGGSQTEYCGGNTVDPLAWTDSNSHATTHPVGQKQANGYGLFDMSGNVYEWTSDCHNKDCAEHALRGGSWGYDPKYARVTMRESLGPLHHSSCNGIRVARVLP